MKKLATFLLMAFGFSMILAPAAFAAEQFKVSEYLKAGDQHKMGYFEQAKGSDISPIQEVVLRVIDILIMVIGSIASLALIIGGIMFIVGAGNEQTVQRGKDIFKFSLLGLIVAIFSFIIITFVEAVIK